MFPHSQPGHAWLRHTTAYPPRNEMGQPRPGYASQIDTRSCTCPCYTRSGSDITIYVQTVTNSNYFDDAVVVTNTTEDAVFYYA